MDNPTGRFSDRVKAYADFRPDYPSAMYDYIRCKFLGDKKIIVDIGSGTGISAKHFLDDGHFVFGVEPNTPMRDHSIQELSEYTNFKAIDGKAEQTTLIDSCCDLVLCAQSFHWFDPVKALDEFKRITHPTGVVLLVWNDRNTEDTEFSIEYEEFLLKHALDYKLVNHKRIDLGFLQNVIPYKIYTREFSNYQDLDYHGLHGRVISSSYMPNSEHSSHSIMNEDLKSLFNRHSFGGKVRITYTTRLFYFTWND